MALKFKLDQTGFDSLDENLKALYKQTDTGYQLDAEGATDKSKLDEFRANNVELLKKLEGFKDVDMEKYRETMEKERKLREKELIDKGEFDTIFNERTAALKSDYDAKLTNAMKQLQDYEQKHNSLIAKYEIEGAASKAFASHRIAPEAHEAALAQIRTKFTIKEGQVLAFDGEKILTGENGNLTVDEFVKNMPDIFKIPSTGGAAKGGSAAPQQHANSRDKIAAGLAKLRGI